MSSLPVARPHLVEESAEELYEQAPCGYFSCLPDGTFVKVNATLVRWLGYEAVDLLYHRRFQDLLTTSGRIYYETHFGPLLQLQDSASEVSFQLRHHDGSLLPVLVSAVKVVDAAGQPLLRRFTVSGATDRNQYEQELLLAKRKAEEAIRLKSRFVSVVSHEIRTPLHTIHSLIDLLLEEPDPARRQELSHTAKTSADDLLTLINHVLDASMLDAGAAALEEAPVDLRYLLARVLGPLQVRAVAKGLALVTNVDADVPALVLADAVKLGQVLTNLVSNAIRFTAVGVVSVALQTLRRDTTSATLLVRVLDTGIGLEAHQLEHIFEDFQQADHDTQLKYGGTGLGLAISQQLVGLYGSRIEVRSQPGEGAVFYFQLHLPIAPDPDLAPTPAALGGMALPPLPGVRVLLADDDPYNVFVLTQYLERWQVSLEVATNGEQAVQMVQANDYDLVLMDLQMPVLDGAEAVQRIRTLGPARYQTLPVVVQSAHSSAELQQLVAANGFTDVLAKPFRPEQLHAIIARFAPATERPAAPAAAFDLSSLRDLTSGNPLVYTQALQLVISNLERFKSYCEHIAPFLLAPATSQELSSHAHRLAATLIHLQAVPLQTTLARLRSLLDPETNATEAEAKATLALVIQQVHLLISGLHIEQARAKAAL